MAIDLETAAHEAVARVQPLLVQLGEAEKDCHTAAEYVAALSKQLDDDEKALEEALGELSKEAGEIEAELSGDAHSATESVSLLVTALQEASAAAPVDLDAE